MSAALPFSPSEVEGPPRSNGPRAFDFAQADRFWSQGLIRSAPLAALVTSSAAHACSVCGQAAPENQWAYLVMTGILSLLPLVLLAGVAAWIWSRIRAAEKAEAPASPPQEPAPQVASPLAPSLGSTRS